jgi:ABC-2 type transport system permease protein
MANLFKKSELQAIYIMWIRQLKRFIRAKSRILGSIIQPLFFLVFLGLGLNNLIQLPDLPENVTYTDFLAPGIVSMSIMFSSMIAGVAVLWDRQFGFLQEVLVAPVSRFSIIIGRTLGGATTALIQGFIILIIAVALGLRIVSVWGFLLGVIFMTLMAFSAVGFGLALASLMKDFQGFQIIMNLLLLPLIFLSSAFFPLDRLPAWLKMLSSINPITYTVDGLRGSLIGVSYFPIITDLIVVLGLCITMMIIGSYLFSKSEV